ncbi:Hypothetical predicted protein [Paramuricea clavata]|uniref:Uncharacterized protein n=1 Tax=Paramuricea clavata TaxID=317549 RepID=A0A7D9D7F3_PARCT|nr:Hypothetical predicted protein [Paramuricea clavata]
MQILPDNTPELDESFSIRLHNVSESNQKLQPGSSELILTIERNDNAGGVFQFANIDTETILSENLNNQLTVTVVRVEGDLDERWVKVKAINAGTVHSLKQIHPPYSMWYFNITRNV